MKVYVVISSYQHGLGEAVETDAEVFDTRDKARKAIRHKGMKLWRITSEFWIAMIIYTISQILSFISQTAKERRGIISIL